MKNSLGLWLASCLVGLQLLAVMIVVTSSYVTSQRVLLNHARDLLSDVGANTAAHSRGFLNPARGAAELAARLAENEIVPSDDRQQLEQLLFQQLQSAPQFAGVYYGDENGNFVHVQRQDTIAPFQSKIISYGADDVRDTDLIWRTAQYEIVKQEPDEADTYDPRIRPWYEKAKDVQGSVWTDPYIFFSSQRPGITIASPVIDRNGDMRGVIGVDIEIDAVSEFLAQLKISDNGTALIVNRNSDVIAHPQPELLKAQNDDGTFRFVSIAEIDDLMVRKMFGSDAIGDLADIQEETYSTFTHGGETYVALVLPVISPELPWTIAVYAPESDFIGAIKQNRFSNVWIAVATAFLTGALGLMLANIIYKPIRAFAVRSSLISQGEINPSDPLPKTYKELDQANQALTDQIKRRKATEHEFGQTFEMASRGMAQLDAKTSRFLRVNQKLAAITGYEIEELLKMSPADLTHPGDPTLTWNPAKLSIEDHAVDLEKRCVRKDGETIWVKVNAIIIRDNDGNPRHAVATMDEITSNKATEAQINKLNRDLSHRVRGELLGQMAAGLAHELNQPLTAITQNADAAISVVKDKEKPDSELMQILGDLDQQAGRAADIIKALRGFARKGEEWKAPFDFDQLLRQSLRLVNAEATEQGVTIESKVQNVPTVMGIRVQIAQVLVNLLRNAIDAVGTSGDNVKIIAVDAHRDGNFVKVSVTDSGPGVADPGKLFTQFETTKVKGMGLGLSICKSIIEAGGGQIWYDTEHTGGARFCFTVPLHTN